LQCADLADRTGGATTPTHRYARVVASKEYADVQAIIYVIDSSDPNRLATSRSELLTMLSEEELASVPVLVFANKQDVEGALKPGEISEKLGLAGGEKGREWSVRGSCATKGEGLEEGLDW
jgi:ADP-ribosylation factor-like protein 1